MHGLCEISKPAFLQAHRPIANGAWDGSRAFFHEIALATTRPADCHSACDTSLRATSGDIIRLHRDVGYNSYSTFSGKLDSKFTPKNHIYLAKLA